MNDLKIAFGSCCRLENRPDSQPVWQAIYESYPDLFLFLGDNIYADASEWKGEDDLRKRYQDQFSASGKFPYLEKLRDQIPYLATWDDHDLGPNNAMGGDTALGFRDQSRDVFFEFMSPSLKGQNGRLDRLENEIYLTYEIEGVLVIVLDVRYHRVKSNRGTGAELLGADQEQWLWRQLKRAQDGPNRATVVCSGSTANDDRTQRLDRYRAFYEKFLIEFNACPTPIMLAGDIHRNKVRPHIRRDKSYFLELICSGLAQRAGKDNKRETLNNWGELTFYDDRYVYRLNGDQTGSRSKTLEGWGYYSPDI